MDDIDRIAFHFVTSADVRPLRREVLRVGMPHATVEFDGDDDNDTFHLAGFDPTGSIVAVSTWMRRPLLENPESPAVQLRGMAVKRDLQSSGVGARLLASGFGHARSLAIDWVWANARDVALSFYRRHGFEVVGEGFIEPVTGLPHHRVRARVS